LRPWSSVVFEARPELSWKNPLPKVHTVRALFALCFPLCVTKENLARKDPETTADLFFHQVIERSEKAVSSGNVFDTLVVVEGTKVHETGEGLE